MRKYIFSLLLLAAGLVATAQTPLEKLLIDNTTNLYKPGVYLVSSSAQQTALEAYGSPLPAGLMFVFKHSSVNMVKVTDGVTLLAALNDLASASGSGMDLTTAQTAAGAKTFSDQVTLTNGATFAAALMPATDGTINFGGPTNKAGTVWTTATIGTGTVTYGTSGAGFGIQFRQGTTTNFVGGIFPTTGNWVIRPGASSLGTDDLTNKLQVVGSLKASQFRLSAVNTAPSSATDTGTAGEIRITADHIYFCPATNTWVRSALTTW